MGVSIPLVDKGTKISFSIQAESSFKLQKLTGLDMGYRVKKFFNLLLPIPARV